MKEILLQLLYYFFSVNLNNRNGFPKIIHGKPPSPHILRSWILFPPIDLSPGTFPQESASIVHFFLSEWLDEFDMLVHSDKYFIIFNCLNLWYLLIFSEIFCTDASPVSIPMCVLVSFQKKYRNIIKTQNTIAFWLEHWNSTEVSEQMVDVRGTAFELIDTIAHFLLVFSTSLSSIYKEIFVKLF